MVHTSLARSGYFSSVRGRSGMMRASFILQLAILVTLLYILSLNLHYCYSQQVFNETMLKQFAADEARLAACGCGG
jgi:hypothetical protein